MIDLPSRVHVLIQSRHRHGAKRDDRDFVRRRAPNPIRKGAAAMKPNAGPPVGQTPLVSLDRLFPPEIVPVFAKLEMLNIGGSVKDRTASHMVEQALASGRIGPGSQRPGS